MTRTNARGLVRAINVKRAMAIYRDPKVSGRRKPKKYSRCETCGKMIKARPCKFCEPTPPEPPA